ncbi:MAG: hypothetical protein IKZ47_01385 [Clostridia bacterium]|nr:hypothetical protein [Clostridia bacterium]
MKKNRKALLIALLNAAIFFILLLFHYSGASIKIAGANPISALALLVAVIMFSSELTGVCAGILTGIVMDGVAATPAGFNTVVLMLLSFAAAILSHYIFNRNVQSAATLCLLFTVVYYIARWLVTFAFAGDLEGGFNYLIVTAAPSAVYTTLFIIPFYYLQKYLFSKINSVR